MCLDVLHLESSCNELIRSTLTVMTSIPRIKLVNAIPAFGFGEILTYNWSLLSFYCLVYYHQFEIRPAI